MYSRLPRFIRNFNLFFDGLPYGGKVKEATLPKLTTKTEDLTAGGLDIPKSADMGMEKLECEITLNDYDESVLRNFGFRTGRKVGFQMRGALVDSLEIPHPVVVQMRGKIVEVDMGNWSAGSGETTMKFKVEAEFYSLSIDGEVLVTIDVDNFIRIIGGEDQLAAIRAVIGRV